MQTETITLSKEAADVLRGMAEFCIQKGYAMGMDEGITKNNRKKRFRKELEQFAGIDTNIKWGCRDSIEIKPAEELPVEITEEG